MFCTFTHLHAASKKYFSIRIYFAFLHWHTLYWKIFFWSQFILHTPIHWSEKYVFDEICFALLHFTNRFQNYFSIQCHFAFLHFYTQFRESIFRSEIVYHFTYCSEKLFFCLEIFYTFQQCSVKEFFGLKLLCTFTHSNKK